MNTPRKIRMATVGSAVLAAMTLLTGCAGGGTPTAGAPNTERPENEIHVKVFGDAAAKVEREAAERFNETSSVKVVIDNGPAAGNDYINQVRSQIGTKDSPDIFMSWGAANIQPYIKAGALMDLNDFVAKDPKLKDSFLPSVFQEEVVDGKTYGIPMRGVGPVVLYYNKAVLEQAGLQPPKTFEDLKSQIQPLKDAGVTPIALGGADKWPDLMWFEYLYSRLAGNEQVAKGLAGDTSVWESQQSKDALSSLSSLIDEGAFGTTYQSVKYGSDGSPKLLSTGKAAYELMGNWNYATIAGDDPTFAETDLGWIPFPSMDGDGQPTELVGNLSNYYNVAADTRYPDTVAKFLASLYSDEFVKGQLAIGNLPPTTNAGSLLNDVPDLTASGKEFLNFQLEVMEEASSFQLSWDQAIAAESKETLNNGIAAFFGKTMDQDQFISMMQSLKHD
jgi:xylobiose transport system substrate-binding protein